MSKTSLYLVLTLLFLFSSCTTYESLLNYNDAPGIPNEKQIISNYAPLRIQVNDRLQISISSNDPVALQPFITSGLAGEEGVNSTAANNEYLVDSQGYIYFPTLGQIQLTGLQLEEARLKIGNLLEPYFTVAPVVQVSLSNFKINVNGEVGNSGSFQVNNNRVTIIEAITLAGDFTSYSRRDSILIIREEEGVREFGYVNFNSSDLFSSPYFYLQQNDVIYVKPAKTKVNSVRDPVSRFLPWITAAVSTAALIFTITRNR